MSWSVSKQGSMDDIRDGLSSNGHVPPAIIDAVDAAALAFDSGARENLTVTTHGHIDTTGKTGNATIIIAANATE